MADPVSAAVMVAIAAGAQVASTVSSIQGARAQAKSASQAANYNAQVANQNAYVANQQGEAAAEQQRRAAAQQMGAMIATYGASGVQGDTGSPMDVLADSASKAALDNMTTKYNYTLRAMGYSNQAALDTSASQNYLATRDTQSWAMGLQGVANVASTASGYYKQNAGASMNKNTSNDFSLGE